VKLLASGRERSFPLFGGEVFYDSNGLDGFALYDVETAGFIFETLIQTRFIKSE
jgi:hypothetical protein